MAPLIWYFDFISPFAYLQWRRMGDLPAGVRVEYRPVLFAGLLDHWESRGPAEIPAKRVFTYRYVHWYAARAGIELKIPPAHPFNPLPALRLALALDASAEAIGRIFDFVWRDGRSIDDVPAWNALAATLGVIDAQAAVSAPGVKARLRANTAEAIGRGVFGVPTFVAGDQLFWGVDATDMLLDYLREPERFSTGEFARAATLPAAAERRR